MKNLTEYITEAASQPKTFDDMLTDLIESDVSKLMICQSDDGKACVYGWLGQDNKVYFEYATKTWSKKETIFRASPDSEIFRDKAYINRFLKKIENCTYAKNLKKFANDVKEDTVKVCHIYGKASESIWKQLDNIEDSWKTDYDQ